MPTAYDNKKPHSKYPTQDAPHSIFLDTHKNFHAGAIVDDSSLDAELHIETTTIMFADVVESVRLIEQDEFRNASRIRVLLVSLARRAADEYDGTVIERRGDGLLVRFLDARRAAACALEFHAVSALANVNEPVESLIQLRIGIHAAAVLIEDGAVYGHGVNVTARVASLAGPGCTVISATVRDQLTHRVDGDLRDMGECYLKNVTEPLRAYELQAVHSEINIPRIESALLPADGDRRHRVTVAVMPLSTLRLVPASLGVADIFVDQVLSVLAISPAINVVSRMSTHGFRHRGCNATTAGALVSADYMVSGSYFETGGNLNARLELLHCASGEVVWERDLTASGNELLCADGDAIHRVATDVLAAVTQTELRVACGKPLPNLAAHTLYLSAITLLHRFSKADFDRARVMLDALRERAPRNAAPAAWLARWHVFRIVQGWSTDVRRDGAQATDFANRALDHDPNSSLALAMSGSVEAGVNRNMSAARKLYDLALEKNPNEPLAWLLKGVAHGFMGEANDALTASDTSLKLSPLDPLRFYYDSLSSAAAMGAESFHRAVALAERAIAANCMHGSAYRTLAIAQVMLNDVDSARETVKRLIAVEPHSTVAQFRARSAVQSPANERYAEALAMAGLPQSLGT